MATDYVYVCDACKTKTYTNIRRSIRAWNVPEILAFFEKHQSILCSIVYLEESGMGSLREEYMEETYKEDEVKYFDEILRGYYNPSLITSRNKK
jgi:hypothetical protein